MKTRLTGTAASAKMTCTGTPVASSHRCTNQQTNWGEKSRLFDLIKETGRKRCDRFTVLCNTAGLFLRVHSDTGILHT